MRNRVARAAVAALAAVAVAGCIDVNFEVTKDVVPDGASAGPFVVNISCVPNQDLVQPPIDQGTEIPPAGTETGESQADAVYGIEQTDDIEFTGESTEVSEDFDDNMTCTITEPERAGALVTTFACTGVEPPEFADAVECTNIPEGLLIVIDDVEEGPGTPDITISILVTNDFTPPAAPTVDPVVVAPTFTG